MKWMICSQLYCRGGSTVQVIAETKIHTGTTDKHGQPDTDESAASTVLHIDP